MSVAKSMWDLAHPWWEFVLRGAIIYVVLLLLLRLTGKRSVGQLASFDLVLLLIISNAVQNAMNAGDSSVVAGLVLACTLVGINWLVAMISARYKRLDQWIEGRPQILIHDGHVFGDVLRDQKVSMGELQSALRQHGYETPEEVHCAILEPNGAISVISTKASDKPDSNPPPR
jgi:uncharacterized membrane protein YcaP (DUF421 family)